MHASLRQHQALMGVHWLVAKALSQLMHLEGRHLQAKLADTCDLVDEVKLSSSSWAALPSPTSVSQWCWVQHAEPKAQHAEPKAQHWETWSCPLHLALMLKLERRMGGCCTPGGEWGGHVCRTPPHSSLPGRRTATRAALGWGTPQAASSPLGDFSGFVFLVFVYCVGQGEGGEGD